jgi:hypothetical protein
MWVVVVAYLLIDVDDDDDDDDYDKRRLFGRATWAVGILCCSIGRCEKS